MAVDLGMGSSGEACHRAFFSSRQLPLTRGHLGSPVAARVEASRGVRLTLGQLESLVGDPEERRGVWASQVD